MDGAIQKIVIVGTVLLAMLIGLVLFGVFLFAGTFSKQANAQETGSATNTSELQVAENQPITINKVLSTPVVYKDLQLTLEGQIVGWVTKNAIIVTEAGEKNGGKKLLVITSEKFRLPGDVPASEVALGENVNVEFTGTAGILSINEGDTNWGDEDEFRELSRWRNTPVIFATSVVQQ